MNAVAVYPGSFDPVTNGHVDLVLRGTGIFQKVIVAVLRNTQKQSLFSVEERVSLLKESLGGIERVEVDAFDGLLVEYARSKGARHILRGIRAVSDFEYEFQMALMNRRLAPDVETVFLLPREEYTYLSSRLVREVALLGGPLEGLVPPPVLAMLRERFPR
ncbi:MAG: pantetheine-phosphate adenylyltransferase [Acidobacteriota bacterium]